MAPAEGVAREFQEPAIHLWLGQHAHLVHYPVMGGALINIVAIVSDDWHEPGWTAVGSRDEILARFPPTQWSEPARMLLDVPTHWLKWALYDARPQQRWGEGPVTLLGDAAHPVLPFLAQGAAMAIEDARVLSECLGNTPDDPAGAMRRYEGHRKPRTARTQRAARRNGLIYHLAGSPGSARDHLVRALGGARLLARYNWLYSWRTI
jgi:salicylate hydroxylase